MMMMPHFGQITANMRRNMTSLEDDVNEVGRKQINLETGHVYYKRGKSSDYLQYRKKIKNDPDHKFDKMMEDGPHYKLWLDSLREEKKDPDF